MRLFTAVLTAPSSYKRYDAGGGMLNVARWLANIIAEFVIVLIVSAGVGYAFGIIQGVIAFLPLGRFRLGLGPHLGVAEVAEFFLQSLPAVAGFIGSLVSVFVGPLIYCFILRGHMTWKALRRGVLICCASVILATTILTVLTFGVGGWLSCFLTPVIAIFVALKVREDSDKDLRRTLAIQST